MLRRAYGPVLRRLLRSFPVVTVLGPRQCGKTTFVRQVLRGWTWVDLELPSARAPIEADPEARLAQLGDRVVFDEAQHCPGLLAVLRSVVDERRSRSRRPNGRFVVLGSAAPALVRGVSESLAGRTAFLDLPPFRHDETAATASDPRTLWFRGGFPAAFLEADDGARRAWFEAYTRAFVERDLPSLGVEVSAPAMLRLWTMLAHQNGGLWNASSLASSLGVSYHTVNRYVDVLEGAFLVRRLPPWSANLSKRLVRSPKVFVRDSGLVHHLLGIHDPATLDVHPARGASFEGFAIDHLIAAFDRFAPGARYSFFRTATGVEADFVVEAAGRTVPFEIKIHTAPRGDDAGPLRIAMADMGAPHGFVLHGGRERYSLGGGVEAVPLAAFLRRPGAAVRDALSAPRA